MKRLTCLAHERIIATQLHFVVASLQIVMNDGRESVPHPKATQLDSHVASTYDAIHMRVSPGEENRTGGDAVLLEERKPLKSKLRRRRRRRRRRIGLQPSVNCIENRSVDVGILQDQMTAAFARKHSQIVCLKRL